MKPYRYAAGVVSMLLLGCSEPPQTADVPAPAPAAIPLVAIPVINQPEPLWAYGFLTQPAPGDTFKPQGPPTRKLRPNEDPAEQLKLRRAEGSEASYSLVDVRDLGHVIDWFPKDHPPMIPIIHHGPASLGEEAKGCGSCHLPNGKGRPENAPVSAVAVPYFIRQMQDFRSGARASADPRKPNVPTMHVLAKAMTDAELQEAAKYFAAIPWTGWTRVVETELVPKTRVVGNLFLALEKERTEPIAGRIIEVPEDEEQTETLRNPHVGFVAYVPPGSINKGENLVMTGGMSIVDGKIVLGRTVICATCHGPDLKGLADVPGIAGRSPSYLVRQLYDLQRGTRKGPSSPLMLPTVAQMTTEDFVSVAAYVTSRVPPK